MLSRSPRPLLTDDGCIGGKERDRREQNQERIEIPPILLYNLCMKEIKYLLAGFIHRFNATEPPAKKKKIKVGK